jgi:hypothetical protein
VERLLSAINVHRVNDVRLTQVHAAKHRFFNVEIAVEKLKRNKSPGIYQILKELVQAGHVCPEIYKFIHSI